MKLRGAAAIASSHLQRGLISRPNKDQCKCRVILFFPMTGPATELRGSPDTPPTQTNIHTLQAAQSNSSVFLCVCLCVSVCVCVCVRVCVCAQSQPIQTKYRSLMQQQTH